MSTVVACDYVDEAPEKYQLKRQVADFDDLFEMCMMGELSDRDQRELDNLYVTLLQKESALWGETPRKIIEMIKEHGSLDFPMIRHELGMLPNKS